MKHHNEGEASDIYTYSKLCLLKHLPMLIHERIFWSFFSKYVFFSKEISVQCLYNKYYPLKYKYL